MAHHYDAAGQAEKAVEYLLAAGDQARLAYANEQAIVYFQRALALLDELSPTQPREGWRLEALDVLGQIYVYRPSLAEVKISMGILAIGFLIFTFMTKIAIAIIFEDFNIGTLRRKKPAPAQTV